MHSGAWLVLAIFLEVSGTVCMKLSAGFTRALPAALMFLFYFLSLSCLTMALKKIDVSVAYAVWSGLGTALITLAGLLWFREPASAVKLFAIGLIVTGVIILNATTEAH